MPRTCTVCQHAKRNEIDAALIEHRPYRDIARRFGPSKDALVRHHDNHLPAALVKAKDAAEVAHADTILDQVQMLRDRATINSAMPRMIDSRMPIPNTGPAPIATVSAASTTITE